MGDLVEQILYYPNGACKARFGTKEGKLHGPSTFYAPSGKILATSTYEEGLQVGEAHFFSLSGMREKLERYQAGRKHGLQEAWYEDGSIRSRMEYEDGSLHGNVELFWVSGKPKRVCSYVQHQKEGWDRIWDAVGRLLYEGKFSSNRPIGLHRYFIDGMLSKEWHYNEMGHCKKRAWDREGVLICEEEKHA